MKKLLALVLILSLVLSCAVYASADDLEMSDIPGMTAAGVLPIVTEPVTITFGFSPNATVSDFYDNDWTHWLQDNTGITIEFFFLPSENPGQKLELMIASREALPDIIDSRLISNANLYNYYEEGLILPMDEYAEKYSFYLQDMIDTYYEGGNEDWQNLMALCRTFDGAWLKFPSTYCDPTNRYNPGSLLWLRDDWLAQWGDEAPSTPDELYDFLKFCHDNDVNGNGDPSDEIGMIGGVDVVLNAYTSFLKWNGAYINVDADGNVYMPQVTENYKHAMQYLNKLYSEELISSQSFTADNAQLKSICTVDDPTEAITPGFGGWHPTAFLDSTFYRNQYTPTLLQSDEYPYHYVMQPQYQSSTMAITGYCEHPEVAFRLMDYFCEYETMIRSRWGTPGEDWNWIEDPENYTPRFDYLGYPVIYNVDHNPYADSAANEIWKKDNFTCLPAYLMGARPAADYKDADAEGYGIKYNKWQAIGYEIGPSPEEVQTIIYTSDEENAIMDISNSIITYVEECRTRFILGEMDIDAEWDSYIDTINAIGYEEYMSVVQGAYDRMYK